MLKPTSVKAVLSLVLVALFQGLVAAQEQPQPEIFKQPGDLPIVISAPHGGALKLLDVPERKGEGQAKVPGKFVTARDSGTEELANELSAALKKKLGKQPFVVASRIHRKYLDPNRPAETAFEDPRVKPYFNEYHQSLTDYCREVQKRFRQGIVVDLHGQGTSAKTVYRGTQNGKTVALLRERFGEQAHTGEESLSGLLKQRGWTVFPDPFDGREQAGFVGGYIVQTYGGNSGFGMDAIQLEFGQDYRSKEARAKTAEVLADALVEYASRYLNYPAAATRVHSERLMRAFTAD